MEKKTTEKLYDEDAYAREFAARVESCEPEGDSFLITLDRTLFFPEAGGQTPDRGVVRVQPKDASFENFDKNVIYASKEQMDDGPIPVTDVQIEGEVVYHRVPSAIAVGTEVCGCIDWDHRFDNMQQHSAEHIFSGTVHRLYGYENVGFHLSDNTVTMDFSGSLDEEQIRNVESIVNRAIYENVEIDVSFPTKEELAKTDFRSKKEIEGRVRLVTIPGYDVCACCAPHVHRTGEIGILKVQSFQRYKQGTRVQIICGGRALRLFKEEHDLMTKLSNDFSLPFEEIGGRIDDLKDEIYNLKGRLMEADRKLSEIKRSMIPADQKNVLLIEDDMDALAMRKSVNELTDRHPGYCGIFSGNDKDGYRFIVGIKDGDARIALSALQKICNAKGGGSPQMVQGSADNLGAQQLRELWEKFEKV